MNTMVRRYDVDDLIYVKDLGLEGKVVNVLDNDHLLVIVANNRMVVDPDTQLIVRD